MFWPIAELSSGLYTEGLEKEVMYIILGSAEILTRFFFFSVLVTNKIII